MRGKSNWADVNNVLISKGWVFYNSQKGDAGDYSIVTWSYNKSQYSNDAQGWFYFLFAEGTSNGVVYTTTNLSSYQLIQNSLSANGFTYFDSEVEDNKSTTVYASKSYKLEISLERVEKSYSTENSVTRYSFVLIMKTDVYKASIPDPYESYSPELVATTFLNLISNTDYVEAKKLATGDAIKTIETLESFASMSEMSGDNSTPKKAKIENMKCNVGVYPAQCTYLQDGKEGLISLMSVNGAWKVSNFPKETTTEEEKSN